MSKFLVTKYQSLEAYTPGEQPQDRKYIKLNTNESPYPPSEGVLAAVCRDEAALLRLYPDPSCKILKEKLAGVFGLTPKNIFVSNSSDDVLNMSFIAFASDEKKACYADITYGFYKVFAELHGVKSVVIPLKDDFSLDPGDYMGIENSLIVIANPNAPTGIAIGLDDIKKICLSSKSSVVIIDEAYVDFGGESAVRLLGECPNLIVCRTFSKSASMAGARLGFAMASDELIEDLEKIKYSTNPYSVNRITMAAGIAALEDIDYYRQNCRRIISTREWVRERLLSMGFKVNPSKTNFLFAKPTGISGERLFARLKENGILVRRFDSPKVKDYLRITIGSEEEMQSFVEVTERILKGELSTH